MTFAVNIAQGGSNNTTMRNRIINGAMMIDQRNAGAAVTSTGSYPVDRFVVGNTTDGAFSAQQNSSAPAGFINSAKFTVTTADATLATTQQLTVQHRIEGNNITDLGWGTANAQPVTLSFWVRSSLTGTFGGALRNSANDRSYPFTYSISVANTWEQKSVTIAGDTTGTWLTTNDVGIRLIFSLGAGTDISGTAGAWAAASYVTATGAVSVIGTLNATWYVTGVQLEEGTTASPFEYRLYGTELALCQRYTYVPSAVYQAATASGLQYNASAGFFSLQFPVFMRTAPTLNSITASNWAVLYQGSAAIPTAITLNASAPSGASLFTSQTLGAGNPIILWPTNTSAQMIFSAEL